VLERTEPLKPILVLPVYRGGARFTRALASIPPASHHFTRILISVNSAKGSPDDVAARATAAELPNAEVITTGQEMIWVTHQYFWMDYLEKTGVRQDDWIYWLAHDDELKPSGIDNLVDEQGNWPLQKGTIYMGPWAMRHEGANELFSGPTNISLESWTSFPLNGPLRLPVTEWIAQQLEQPTYINMGGSIATYATYQAMRNFRIKKPGGTRIEMVAAAARHHSFVEEFTEPVVISYGRPNSARTQFDAIARKDDLHLMAWLVAYVAKYPSAVWPLLRAGNSVMRSYARRLTRRGNLPSEDWRFREIVDP
jgi:hypothetical protein